MSFRRTLTHAYARASRFWPEAAMAAGLLTIGAGVDMEYDMPEEFTELEREHTHLRVPAVVGTGLILGFAGLAERRARSATNSGSKAR